MNQSNDDTMLVLLAGYSSVGAAVSAFDAVRAACDSGGVFCDAAVIDPHDTDLDSRVVRESPSAREQQALGARVESLAKRLAGYLALGLALTGGPAGGSGEDMPATAVSGDTAGPLDAEDVNRLGAVQKTSTAVLIGIFPAMMSASVTVATNGADARESKEIRASAELLEAQIVKAERMSITDARG
jgi:hypothetical protein